ncbi:Cytidylate kinase-like family protein [Ruminococcus sp. YE71]|uniref:cytidylate kinase-like family protein n=1 Tax=unclassified Ruminococcus TaxID=2608920 RepID=UPI000881CC80|nr:MULTISPECIES: cytidylate kinase-like family protein [unclassified Ruminococcus]SDA16766.1 Cytidylate kinase-like family protein [Ruminococcus sp. YE78]SFW25594.1 Cytidylate kinase-like family protein [Ruminococcus sp. YE71]
MRSVITIGREFGSGGREIGKRLAELYGIPFYDKKLLEESAKQSGICEDLFVRHDESMTNSFLYSLVMGTYPMSADGRMNPEMPLNHRIFLAQFETIRKLGEKPCVIVGRCADYVLQENKNRISVFITGNMFEKKRRIAERYDIEKPKIEDFIRKTDKRRANYYEYYTDNKWGMATNYDVTVNSSIIGIEGAVKLISEFVAMKESATSDT